MREYLRSLRRKHGLSTDDVARIMDITSASYSMIETGRRQQDMSLGMMCRLAAAFDVSVEDIFRNELSYKQLANNSA